MFRHLENELSAQTADYAVEKPIAELTKAVCTFVLVAHPTRRIKVIHIVRSAFQLGNDMVNLHIFEGDFVAAVGAVAIVFVPHLFSVNHIQLFDFFDKFVNVVVVDVADYLMFFGTIKRIECEVWVSSV